MRWYVWQWLMIEPLRYNCFCFITETAFFSNAFINTNDAFGCHKCFNAARFSYNHSSKEEHIFDIQWMFPLPYSFAIVYAGVTATNAYIGIKSHECHQINERMKFSPWSNKYNFLTFSAKRHIARILKKTIERTYSWRQFLRNYGSLEAKTEIICIHVCLWLGGCMCTFRCASAEWISYVTLCIMFIWWQAQSTHKNQRENQI